MAVEQFLSQLDILINNPALTLLGSLGLAFTIILLDFETGISYKVPGKGRIGLAAIIAITGSVFYFFATGGIQAFAGEIAAGIFSATVTAFAIAYFLKN